jgi:hypothetical protein
MVGHAVFVPATCSLEFDLISGAGPGPQALPDHGAGRPPTSTPNATLVLLGRVPAWNGGVPVSVTADGVPLPAGRVGPGPGPHTLQLQVPSPPADAFTRYVVVWATNGTTCHTGAPV